MKRVLKYHWRAILWVVIIFVICLLPAKDLPNPSFLSRIPYFDKIVHFGMYFILTLFLIAGFTRQYDKSSVEAYFFSFLIAYSCGVTIELLQPYAGRSLDICDAAANTTGIIVAIIFYRPIKWILRNLL